MIDDQEAERLAREAVAGVLKVADDATVSVERRGVVVVTFARTLPAGVRGPDFDAKVTLDTETGDVIEILGS